MHVLKPCLGWGVLTVSLLLAVLTLGSNLATFEILVLSVGLGCACTGASIGAWVWMNIDICRSLCTI